MLADPVVSLKCISTIDIDYPSISTTISQEETASEPFDLCQQRVSWHGTSYPDTVSKNQCSLKQEVSSAQNICWLTIIWYYAVQSVGDDDNWEIRSQPASLWRDDIVRFIPYTIYSLS